MDRSRLKLVFSNIDAFEQESERMKPVDAEAQMLTILTDKRISL